ncbi:MAG TPA: XdhC family protein [Pyrinomonadaceae bacterium]|jgi:xanthine dehydrogenase accessory factor|nr:XdhC family protein [Pyrinomonadaceae bacterium]
MHEAGDQSNPPAQRIAEAIARILEDGEVAVLATLVESPQPPSPIRHAATGAKLLFNSSGEHVAGGTGDAALDREIARRAHTFHNSRAEAQTFNVEEFPPQLSEGRGARVLFERIENEPHIVVCGAGHVGASLARLAQAIGYRATLIDDRADFVARTRFPENEIELVAANEGWTSAVRAAVGRGRGVSVAVVTRGHNEDEECLRAVVAARPDYVGMIGSRRRTNIVLERLRETGVEEEILREVRAPVGLDIGAVSPEEVALAVLAEIVAKRRGGSGRPLSAWRRA